MKQLFGVYTDFWVPCLLLVKTAFCSDCGTLVYKSSSIGLTEFYFLDEEQVAQSEFVALRSRFGLSEVKRISADWARKNLARVSPELWIDGLDEVAAEQVYCPRCAKKVIVAVCREGCRFERTRDLPGGQACDKHFMQEG